MKYSSGPKTQNSKRKAVFLLALAVLAAGLTGCGSETGIALTVNGSAEIDSEIFTYFLNYEYWSGGGSYDSEYISRATNDCLAYVTVNSACRELGVRLNGAEKADCSLETNSLWRLYEDYLTELGVSKDSFFKIKQYEYMKDALRFALYDTGGYQAIPESDLKAYFNGTYAGIKYYYESLYTVLPAETLAGMTAAQLENYNASVASANDRYERLTRLATLVNSDQYTIDEAYMAATGDVNEGAGAKTAVLSNDSSGFTAEFINAVFSQQVGTTFIVTNADRSYIYFVERIGLFDDGDALFNEYRDECLRGYSESFLINEINTRSAGFKAVRHTDVTDKCLERVKKTDRSKYAGTEEFVFPEIG